MGKESAIDHVKVRAGIIANGIMSEIKVWDIDQYEIRSLATDKLTEVIYEYETRVCERCASFGLRDMNGELDKEQLGLGYCIKGVASASIGFGCKKFEGVINGK